MLGAVEVNVLLLIVIALVATWLVRRSRRAARLRRVDKRRHAAEAERDSIT